MGKRKDKRFNTKLYVKVKTDSPLLTCWAELCNVSEKGLFIKSVRKLTTGTAVDMEIFMPGLTPCLLRGNVKRVVELSAPDGRFGIGVELTGKNMEYDHLLRFIDFRSEKTCTKTIREAFFNSI